MLAADAKVDVKVCERFTNHFVVKHNVTFERWKFNCHVQGPNEPVDTFITSLYMLAETCKYGVLQDELMPDHLVVRLWDVALSECLQLDSVSLWPQLRWRPARVNSPDRKVHGANMGPIWGRQDPGGSHVGPMNLAIWEVKRQQCELGGQQPGAVDTVSHKFPKKKTSSSRPPHPGKKIDPQSKHSTGNQCKWCGREPHACHVCPTKEATLWNLTTAAVWVTMRMCARRRDETCMKWHCLHKMKAWF